MQLEFAQMFENRHSGQHFLQSDLNRILIRLDMILELVDHRGVHLAHFNHLFTR